MIKAFFDVVKINYMRIVLNYTRSTLPFDTSSTRKSTTVESLGYSKSQYLLFFQQKRRMFFCLQCYEAVYQRSNQL
jgi:hypothetical protein